MVTNIVKGLLKNYKEEAEKHETQLTTKIDRLTTDVDKFLMENETRLEKLCEAKKKKTESYKMK
jgi:hypothetical protein